MTDVERSLEAYWCARNHEGCRVVSWDQADESGKAYWFARPGAQHEGTNIGGAEIPFDVAVLPCEAHAVPDDEEKTA
jgi:hypothetical protein